MLSSPGTCETKESARPLNPFIPWQELDTLKGEACLLSDELTALLQELCDFHQPATKDKACTQRQLLSLSGKLPSHARLFLQEESFFADCLIRPTL